MIQNLSRQPYRTRNGIQTRKFENPEESKYMSGGIVDVKVEQEEVSVTFLDTSGLPCQAPVSTANAIVKLQDEDNIKLESNASAMSGLRKKRRLVVEVVVPTLERLKLDKKNVEDEVKKLFKVSNPQQSISCVLMTVSLNLLLVCSSSQSLRERSQLLI